MKSLTTIESDILDLIPIGNERKISIAEIAQIIDVEERKVYQVINSLRKKGVPVCAKRDGDYKDRGYYIATSEAERAEGLAAYKAQVTDMQILIELIEDANLGNWMQKVRRN